MTIEIPENELQWSAIRAQGAGGQNVNKVASALHLRYDVRASSLPEEIKARLLARPDQRLTGEGVIVIKAQRYRTQEKNREDALSRLRELIEQAATVAKPRKPTKVSRAAKRKRLETKVRRGKIKAGRSKVDESS